MTRHHPACASPPDVLIHTDCCQTASDPTLWISQLADHEPSLSLPSSPCLILERRVQGSNPSVHSLNCPSTTNPRRGWSLHLNTAGFAYSSLPCSILRTHSPGVIASSLQPQDTCLALVSMHKNHRLFKKASDTSPSARRTEQSSQLNPKAPAARKNFKWGTSMPFRTYARTSPVASGKRISLPVQEVLGSIPALGRSYTPQEQLSSCLV